MIRDKVTHGVYGFLADYEKDTHKAVGYIDEAYHMEIFNRVVLALLSSGIPSLEGKTVLDIGAGAGQIARFLVDKMGMKIESYTGIERIEKLLSRQELTEPAFNEKGEQTNKQEPVFHIIADKFPSEQIKEQFDVVLMVGTCSTYPMPWDLIKDALNSVKDGGTLLFTMLDTDKYDGQFYAQTVDRMVAIAKTLGESFQFFGGRECVVTIQKKAKVADARE